MQYPVIYRCGVAIMGGALARIDADADSWLSQALRRERRLGSVPRRLVADAVNEALRRWRFLEMLLHRGGWDGARRDEALWEAALIRAVGRSAEDAATAFGADIFSAFGDPAAAVADWCAETPDEATRLGVLASLTDDVAARLLAEREDAWGLAAALSERAPMTLRVSPRIKRKAALKALAEADIEARAGHYSHYAVHLEGRPQLTLLSLYKRGLIEVQDEASQLIAALVAPPKKGLTVDFCAGAGGKSLAIAARGAKVHALDVRGRALAEAQKRAKRARVSLKTTRIDPEGPLPIAAGSAARVLVDAPCTGSGAIRRQPGNRWRITEERIAAFSALQRQILDRASDLVAPGGRLIYATCSLLAQENQEVADAFLSTRPGWTILPASEVLGINASGVITDGPDLSMDPSQHGSDGFYARVFKREGPTDPITSGMLGVED